MVTDFEEMKDPLKDGMKEEENELIKEQIAVEDSNIMIDFEAVKNPVKQELKEEESSFEEYKTHGRLWHFYWKSSFKGRHFYDWGTTTVEDTNIMIDFEAVKNPLKKELKKEDKFVDLKSWADAFNKQKMVETIEEVNKGVFHGFDATDIPKSKISVHKKLVLMRK